jgi:hypothetical protein
MCGGLGTNSVWQLDKLNTTNTFSSTRTIESLRFKQTKIDVALKTTSSAPLASPVSTNLQTTWFSMVDFTLAGCFFLSIPLT